MPKDYYFLQGKLEQKENSHLVIIVYLLAIRLLYELLDTGEPCSHFLPELKNFLLHELFLDSYVIPKPNPLDHILTGSGMEYEFQSILHHKNDEMSMDPSHKL